MFTFDYIIKIDGDRFPGGAAHSGQSLAPEERVDERAFSNVGAAGKGDLWADIARKLRGKPRRDLKLGRCKIDCHSGYTAPVTEIPDRTDGIATGASSE